MMSGNPPSSGTISSGPGSGVPARRRRWRRPAPWTARLNISAVLALPWRELDRGQLHVVAPVQHHDVAAAVDDGDHHGPVVLGWPRLRRRPSPCGRSRCRSAGRRAAAAVCASPAAQPAAPARQRTRASSAWIIGASTRIRLGAQHKCSGLKETGRKGNRGECRRLRLWKLGRPRMAGL